jgi:decaprenyl-phosphate phosphoribosyltransferase
MFTLCLFMGFCKRYNEMVTIADRTDAGTHRRTLIAYTPELLTHLVTLSAGIAVVGFLLYSLSESTIKRFETTYFVYTLPVVIYGIFRFAMLSMRGVYADPTDIILRDRPFQLNMIFWVGAAVGIITYGQRLGDWLGSLY